MKLHNTKVCVNSPEQSKQFQEAVFAAGGCWLSGDKFLKHLDLPYLYVTITNHMFVTSCSDQFEQNPSPDITEEFFGISLKPNMLANPKVGNKIYHVNDLQQSLHNILYIGDQIALIQNNEGQEFTVNSNFAGWQRFDPFTLLTVDDPVWVRDNQLEEWMPRHYASNQEVFAFGKSLHTQLESNHTCVYKYWRHKTFGEWEYHSEE